MTPIDLYTWKTSNGKKATIMMEECGLDYRIHPIDISTDIQFAEDFLKINPNSKIPAIVDHDGPNG
ncbi:MAG: glutathione S-transferase family protein, partial [Rhodospirillaceae bacterium]|nr:glutathione S-transferase family protein [Rhodospirillaceae bacterium]